MVVILSSACPVPDTGIMSSISIQSIAVAKKRFSELADPVTLGAGASQIMMDPDLTGDQTGLRPDARDLPSLHFREREVGNGSASTPRSCPASQGSHPPAQSAQPHLYRVAEA
jgi:hypothetical protein